MKILQISPSYKPAYVYGGPTASIAMLCEELSATGCNPEVMTTTANGKTELQVPLQKTVLVNGVRVRYFKRITKDHTHFSPSLLWALYKELNKKPADLILHIHSWWNLVAIFSCLLAKFKKVPVVLSPRGMLTTYSLNNRHGISKYLIHKLIGRPLIAYCHVHATTPAEEQDILKICRPKRITTIPNFACQVQNTQSSAANQNPGTDQFNIIYLSRIEEKKGLEILFQSLNSCSFPWKLTIAGQGSHEYVNQLKLQACRLNISRSIKWIGHIGDNTKYQLIANHHLLVLFSHNENFANVIIESLSVGTPVAVSNKVGLAPYIQENDLGWVSKLNPLAITQTLNRAFKDLKKRKSISINSPQIIKNHFSAPQILTRYLQLYKNSK